MKIIDRFKTKGEHRLEWNLILSPGFKQELKIVADKFQWHRGTTFYSPEYGTIVESEKFFSIQKTANPTEVKILIEVL